MLKSSTIQIEDSEGLTKVDIRQKVWNHFQENDLANFPLSVYRRIPNFKGADEAGGKLAELDCFKTAKSVKVNLDKPQGEVRYLTLDSDKTLYVPTPGLRSGLFNRMDNTSAGENTAENLRLLAQNDGMKRFSQSLQLDDAAKVDLIVVGSVAVSKSGHRIGKGEGFVDLEYGMMRHMKCVTEKTLIVTTVHDCQVFDELPTRLLGSHDVPVDVIVTPTQVIRVSQPHSRPVGILWNLISPEKFYRVAILRTLWQRTKDAGENVVLSSDEPVPTEEQIAEYWKNIETEREANREARANRPRGQGRRRGARRGGGGSGSGSGGRGGRRRYDDEEEVFDEEGNRIQVTVNVDKRNRIVRRSVRASNQPDREGDAAASEGEEGREGGRRGGRGRGRRERKPRGYFNGPPPFSIFLGNVPPNSRTREIKEAVKHVIDDKAQGVDIQRRTQAGYAFLRFSRLGPEHADDLVSALQGLKVLDQEVVVERARDRPAREEGEQNGSGEGGAYEGGEDQNFAAAGGEAGGDAGGDAPSGGFRGGRGGRRGAGGKRYRGARRGRGGGDRREGGNSSGGEDRRRRVRDDEGGSGGEEYPEGRDGGEPAGGEGWQGKEQTGGSEWN